MLGIGSCTGCWSLYALHSAVVLDTGIGYWAVVSGPLQWVWGSGCWSLVVGARHWYWGLDIGTEQWQRVLGALHWYLLGALGVGHWALLLDVHRF